MLRIAIRNLYHYHSKDGAVGRKTAKATLLAGRRDLSKTMLLPPFVGASELRVMLNLSYGQTMQVLGVRNFRNKYYWKDSDGREFETANRKKVVVGFDVAARAAKRFGWHGVMVDVEPEWNDRWTQSELERPPYSLAIPVVAVIGHVNHGKTTLLKALRGRLGSDKEPGGITQEVSGFTLSADRNLEILKQSQFGSVCEPSSEARPSSLEQTIPISFIDTPGHATFEISRARSLGAADLALVVVEVGLGAQQQTIEGLSRADAVGMPVIFAITKTDLVKNADTTKSALSSTCLNLYKDGTLECDYSEAAKNAVEVSGVKSSGLAELLGAIHAEVSRIPCLPRTLPDCPSVTPRIAAEYSQCTRRTDWQVDMHPPSSIGIILDHRKGDHGSSLTVVLKSGNLKVGDHFVAGTLYGRVSNMIGGELDYGKDFSPSVVAALPSNRRQKALDMIRRSARATPGMVVEISGIISGDCAPDDVLMGFPKQRAHRLSSYRARIAALNDLQTSGSPIEVPWELDGSLDNPRTHAKFSRGETVERLLAQGDAKVARDLIEDEPINFQVSDDLNDKSFTTSLFNPNVHSEIPDLCEIKRQRALDEEKLIAKESERRRVSSAVLGSDSVELENQRVLDRWNKKELDKVRATALAQEKINQEKVALREIRSVIYDREASEITTETPRPRPIMPVILKTRSVAVFNALLDEIEVIESTYGLSIPVVHGGVGNVNVKDVDHAEVEKNYGYCPIYSLGVSISSKAETLATKGNIGVFKFDVFTEVLDHISERCQRVIDKAEKIRRAEDIRRAGPGTSSGL